VTPVDLVTTTFLLCVAVLIILVGFKRLIRIDRILWGYYKRDRCKPHKWDWNESGKLTCTKCGWVPGAKSEYEGFNGP
jgi:hypothetical protein